MHFCWRSPFCPMLTAQVITTYFFEIIFPNQFNHNKHRFPIVRSNIRINYGSWLYCCTVWIIFFFFSVYYDARQLAPHLDFVTLQNFDFYTPERNPKEADYSSPLYEIYGRKFDENGDFQVRYWYVFFYLQHFNFQNFKVFIPCSTVLHREAWDFIKFY